MPQPPLNQQMKVARQHAGLSVSEVARRAGTSRAAIYSYENGKTSPSLDTAQRVLAASGSVLVVKSQHSADRLDDFA